MMVLEFKEYYKFENWALSSFVSADGVEHKASTLLHLVYRLCKFCVRSMKVIIQMGSNFGEMLDNEVR